MIHESAKKSVLVKLLAELSSRFFEIKVVGKTILGIKKK